MKANAKRFLFGAVAISLLCAPSSLAFAEGPAQASYSLKDLNEQIVMPLAWMQNSAEYRELCYQAFNLAGMIVDKAVSSAKKGDKPLAVVSDLDEALIDNSAYDAGLVGRDAAYAGKTWIEWENANLALAVPGATEFLNAAAKSNVEVFYVTNRDQPGFDGTLKNLAKLGFPFVDAKHLLVSTGSSNKQARFDQVAKEYNVVVYIGDNENDLPIGAYHKSMKDRNALVDQNKEKFGVQFIVLPNPVYGDWEPVLADNYYGLSPKDMAAARRASLRTWVPTQQ
jgi:5'-nucleotidase (lipoprotein e(P4) family)